MTGYLGKIAIALLASASLAGAASAKTYEVKMVNKGAAGLMTYEPAFLQIAPGDSVTFTPADPGHNAETIPTMVPQGAEPFKGALNAPVTVTFRKPGLYGYKCLPHFILGMVGLIEVGSKVDKAAAVAAAGKLSGLAKTRMTALIAQAR